MERVHACSHQVGAGNRVVNEAVWSRTARRPRSAGLTAEVGERRDLATETRCVAGIGRLPSDSWYRNTMWPSAMAGGLQPVRGAGS